MLRRFWRWLSRLWRKPEPLPPDPLLDAGRAALDHWALAKLKADITSSLKD